jgi:hypothetical protein
MATWASKLKDPHIAKRSSGRPDARAAAKLSGKNSAERLAILPFPSPFETPFENIKSFYPAVRSKNGTESSTITIGIAQ